MRFSLRVYRLLLKLYPASFREDYHAPLQQQFREEPVEVTGPLGTTPRRLRATMLRQ